MTEAATSFRHSQANWNGASTLNPAFEDSQDEGKAEGIWLNRKLDCVVLAREEEHAIDQARFLFPFEVSAEELIAGERTQRAHVEENGANSLVPGQKSGGGPICSL